MSISEQVKELRKIANWIFGIPEIDFYGDGGVSTALLHAANTIESLSAQLQVAIMEQPADCGGWIYCGDGENLPEEKINPITNDFYEYQVTFKSEDVTDIRCYKFGRGHWWNGPGIMDEYVIAWRQNIEPYEEKTEAGI